MSIVIKYVIDYTKSYILPDTTRETEEKLVIYRNSYSSSQRMIQVDKTLNIVEVVL